MRTTWLVVVAMVVAACGDNNEGTSDAAGDDTSISDAADECLVCVETATCDPSAPSPCSCPAGYGGDGTTAGTGCTDVDECTAGTADCVDTLGTCTNTDGSFSCGCIAGYDGDGTTGGTGCVDVDECTAGTDGCVDAPGTCANTDGSYTCGCEAGYDGDGTAAGTGCTDIDECTTGADDCLDAPGTCANTGGGYTCGCETGYEGDGTTGGTGCADVDECATGTDGCVDAPGTCANTVGGYTCGCEAGYAGDGTVAGTGCTDINECTAGTAECDGFVCANAPGSYTCQGLYAVTPFRGVLARLNPTTYELMDVKAITNAAGAVTGVPALTTHPTTGVAYAVGKVSGVTGRVFGTLDFTTATLSAVGVPVNNFATLAFLPDGTLYGVIGNGGSPSETMFQIDPATGVPTLFSALGAGADGESICFNPDDGMMYHWSGNGTAIMEKFALTLPLTFVPVSPGLGTGEIFGCRYVGANTFLLSDIASSVELVTIDGVVSPVPDAGGLFDDLRAIIPATMTQPHTVRPITGDIAGGTEITIHGIGLSAATAVTVGGTAATSFTLVDDTTLTAVVPAGTAGTVDVGVALTNNLNGTWPDAFTYTASFGPPAPVHKVAKKRRVAPSSGPSAGQLRKAARGRQP